MLDKNYDPQTLEQTWYQTWESRGCFAPGRTDGGATDGPGPTAS